MDATGCEWALATSVTAVACCLVIGVITSRWTQLAKGASAFSHGVQHVLFLHAGLCDTHLAAAC